MKAILRYTDCLLDGRNVFNTLAIHNVEVLKTKNDDSFYPKITIRIKDMSELNKVVSALNRSCIYGVSIIKVKSEDSLLEKIKRVFE